MLPSRAIGAILLLLAATLPGAGGVAADRVEPVEWLRAYLRIDTSNPPGNEQQAAELLRGILHREGIPTRLYVSPGGRMSLSARLAADPGGAGALVLLHHMDVVPPGEGWGSDPFSGDLEDGVLRGRGAIDAKSLGIAHLAALVSLKRSGLPLSRDVVLLAVADEETGGVQGTGWLVDAHPDLFSEVAGVLGEGGSNRAPRGQIAWWGIEVAQKRPLWLEVTAAGRTGHGSTVNLHSAPHRLVRALDRVIDRPLDFRVSPEARRYLEAVAPLQSEAFRRMVADLDAIVASEAPSKRLLPGIPTYLLDSLQINVLAAGERINAVPGTASALVDARLLPDTDEAAFLADLEARLGEDAGLRVLLRSPRVPPSPTDSPIYRCLEGALKPEGPVVPAFIAGVTDSRYFRERGIPAYGFSPFPLDSLDLRGIHGPNERIRLGAFERGVEVMKRVVRACATG